MVESFWAVPDVANFRTPLSILREQATALTEQTNGALVGIVETASRGDGDLNLNLSVQVPSLDNYVYRLLRYQQPIDSYPGQLFLAWAPGDIGVRDEGEFVLAVKAALSSDKVRGVVGSLLAQSTAA